VERVLKMGDKANGIFQMSFQISHLLLGKRIADPSRVGEGGWGGVGARPSPWPSPKGKGKKVDALRAAKLIAGVTPAIPKMQAGTPAVPVSKVE